MTMAKWFCRYKMADKYVLLHRLCRELKVCVPISSLIAHSAFHSSVADKY